MAFPNKVWRATISGTCYGAQEVWSTGFYVADMVGDMGVPLQANVDALATRWQTFWVLASTLASNSYLTTQVKIAHLNTDGSTVTADTVFKIYTTPIAGTSASKPVPQQALVLSMKSLIARGMAAKGRMYLPGIAAPLGTDARITASDAGAIASSIKTLFDGYNTDLGGTRKVALCSPGRTLPSVIAGQIAPVSTVAVGNVYDTQRRRRNGLIETYQTRVLA